MIGRPQGKMLKRLFRREELTDEERAQREAGKAHAARVRESEKAHVARVKEAERAVRDGQKTYDKGVKGAEKAVQEAAKTKVVARLGFFKLTLYEDRIQTPDGTCELSPGVSASVDTAGSLSSRITATRLVTLGVFALAAKKKKDNRELYVMINTPSFTSVQQINADKGREARQFAAKVNTQAKQAGPIIQARNQRTANAQAQLQRVKADRSAVEAVEAALVALSGAAPSSALIVSA